MSQSHQRVVIVTGAGNGLGACFARRLAADGYAVVVNNRTHPDRPSSAEGIAREIREAGGTAVADGHAVDQPGAATGIVRTALDAFGRIDALVLNAGTNGRVAKVGSGDSDIDAVMRVNFYGSVELVEAAMPQLLASPAGRIVFVSSSAGLYGTRGRVAYAASKGAINAYSVSLADELRRTGIRVNTVMPFASTKMTDGLEGEGDPLLQPGMIAPLVGCLADPRTDRTGEQWVACGGRVRRACTIEEGEGHAFDAERQTTSEAAPAGFGGWKTFTAATAAFADFYAEVSRAA